MPDTTRRGRMATDRPERYAKQLGSHWAPKGSTSVADGVTTIRFDTGQVVVLTPNGHELVVEVAVPDGGDVVGFSEVVTRHLQRFGTREELQVAWE